MILNRLILTTTKKFNWHSSFPRINAIQALTPGLRHGVTDVERIDLATVPTYRGEDGEVRIDFDWLRTLRKPGYSTVCLHLSKRDRDRFKLSKKYAGMYRNDPDDVFDYYVIADTRFQFERMVLHEEGHGVEQFTLGYFVDWVHYYDYVLHDLQAFYRRMDFTTHNALIQQRDLLTTLSSLLRMRKTFLQVCTESLGIDVTPDDLVPDVVACAITVSTLINKLDQTFPKVAGTWTLMDIFDHRKDWKKVTDPRPGDIVLSPTGTGLAGTSGHVGVVMEDGSIASNDSASGKFIKNFTMDSWTARYAQKQGMPVFLYRKEW